MKKKKQLNNNRNYPLIAIVVFSLIAVIYIIMTSNGKQNISYPKPSYAPTQTTKEKIYRSKILKFSISIPSKLQVEDKDVQLTLFDDNGRQIKIIRNGTNYDNLSDYIANFDARRNLIASEVRRVSIDGKDAMSRMVEFPEESVKQKAYYIYSDNSVYILSTSFEDLFSDLDTIAQSFRYAP